MAAIELGVPYYFYNNAGTEYFALNAPTDPNFVGYVSDITGLDDAGVRENAQVVVAGDGGYHGPFWRDRRPWTMSGAIMPQFPLLARDQSQELIEAVLGQCLQLDGSLLWTPADGIERFLPFRKQQPVRMTTGQSNVQKNFQLALVTADYRIKAFNEDLLNATGPTAFGGNGVLAMPSAVNLGNADASPVFEITGPCTTPKIINATTSKQITLNFNIASGQIIAVDLRGAYPGVFDTVTGANYYGQVDPLNTDWSIAVSPGANAFSLFIPSAFYSTATSMALAWQHSWV